MEWNLLGDNLSLTITKNHGAGRGESSESIHALLSAVLLPETNGHIEKDNKGQDTTFNVVLDAEAQSHGECQNLSRWSVSTCLLALSCSGPIAGAGSDSGEKGLGARQAPEAMGIEATYDDHGIEDLLGKDAVPWYSLAYVELILGVFLLELRDLLRSQPFVDARAKGLSCLLNAEEERVLWKLSHTGVFSRRRGRGLVFNCFF